MKNMYVAVIEHRITGQQVIAFHEDNRTDAGSRFLGMTDQFDTRNGLLHEVSPDTRTPSVIIAERVDGEFRMLKR